MTDFIQDMNVFFNSITETIQAENQDLYELISKNKKTLKLHKSISPNFYFLNNCTISYLIYKKILSINWPYEVLLQHYYPQKNHIADLIIKKDSDTIACINLLRWKSNESNEIKSYLENFRLIKKKIRRFVIVFWIEEKSDNYFDWLKIDLDKYFKINLISEYDFSVVDFDFYNDKEIQKKAVITMFELT